MKTSRILWLVAPAAAAVVFFAGVLPRLRAAQALGERASTEKVVNIVVAQRSKAPTEVTLPASIEAFQDTPIYARTTGYIARWLVDIGDPVKAGQVMAVIDGPDLDQELNQAKAALEQAKASLAIAKISADRWKELGAQNAVAQQDVDQKAADFAAAQAAVGAAQANVDRLSQLKDFQQVTAPYDGVVSARNAQVGALVNAGAGIELFHVAQTSVLRVFASVPQTYFRDIHEGLPAEVLVPEFPGRVFTGTVARYAGTLSTASRTLLTEIHLPNPKGELLAGMYGQVRFRLEAPTPTILIPSGALIVNAAGTQMATIDAGNHVHIAKVKVGRDFGTQIEVLTGIDVGARVVTNPSDALSDGLEVVVSTSEDASKK